MNFSELNRFTLSSLAFPVGLLIALGGLLSLFHAQQAPALISMLPLDFWPVSAQILYRVSAFALPLVLAVGVVVTTATVLSRHR